MSGHMPWVLGTVDVIVGQPELEGRVADAGVVERVVAFVALAVVGRVVKVVRVLVVREFVRWCLDRVVGRALGSERKRGELASL